MALSPVTIDRRQRQTPRSSEGIGAFVVAVRQWVLFLLVPFDDGPVPFGDFLRCLRFGLFVTL